MQRLITLLLLLTLSGTFVLAEGETDAGPNKFASFWVDKSATLQPGVLEQTLAEIDQQDDDPDQIVVFVHGFKKPREGSTRDFNALAERVRNQFSKRSDHLALVGLQWESGVTIPNSSGLNALRMMRAYQDTIPLARSVGRGPGRRLLLALQDKYPNAHISVMAHSMGCEVAAAALLPEIRYEDYKPFVEVFEPDRPIQLEMLVLAGSDLDYDFWYTSGLSPREMEGRAKMTWLTVADYLGKGDKTLNTRRRVRGRAAGTSFPRMTLAQLDQALSERRIFIDHQAIPRNHGFLDYYEEPRLVRIAATLRYLTMPRAPQPDEIAELDEILAAPNDLETLLPYLDRPSYASKFYALWRLERVNCGDARHMTDETLDDIAEMLKYEPEKIRAVLEQSDCVTVREGQFPSQKALREAGVSTP